ncbi:hypothetical protein H4582DRAFT_2084047 [Lactarius indigo]|nr:hypothetical protein H4582DRAFT_2084047 [Lactarius indigo]
MSTTPAFISAISEEPGLRRRKTVKGYAISSGESDYSFSDSDSEVENTNASDIREPPIAYDQSLDTYPKGYAISSGESDYSDNDPEVENTNASDIREPPIAYDESSDTYPNVSDIREPPIAYDESLDTYPDSLESPTNTNAPSTISVIFPSLLPTSYVSDTIDITVTSGISYVSNTFYTLTYYRELREAQVTQLDSDFDQILVKLELIHYPSCFPLPRNIDTSVFGFSSGNLSNVNSVAKRALVISSVTSALGLFVDVWFIFAYSSADVRKFQTLAVDLYDTYFFFALSSRLPLVALFVAVIALVVFLGAIAWSVWPTAVFVMCVLASVLVFLQFIVYGCHRLALGLMWMVHGAWLGVLYVARRVCALFVRGAATASQGEQQMELPTMSVPQVVVPPASARVPRLANSPV